jgi:hypothetical protein
MTLVMHEMQQSLTQTLLQHVDLVETCAKKNINNLGGVLFALVHLRTFHPTTTTHPNCVFLLLTNDTHIVGFASNVLFFVITKGVWHIKTFSVANKKCHLVSIGDKPIYITSSRFFLHLSPLSYSKCFIGFFAICGVLHVRSNLGRP